MFEHLSTAIPSSVRHPFSAVGDKMLGWLEAAIENLPNAGVAVISIWLSWVLGKFFARWICKALLRVSVAPQLQSLAQSLVRIAGLGMGTVLALHVLNLDRAVATALASVGVVGLALGFAFQETAANLISGVFMAVKQPFGVGDVIESNGYKGSVEHVGLRATELRQLTGELVMIPNRKIFSEAMTNFSRADARRVDIAVGVSYDDDLDLTEQTALQALDDIPDALAEPTAHVFFRSFGSSSVDLELRFWVPYGADPLSYLRGRSDAIKALRKHFERAGLNIPFPIRTLDIPPGQLPTDKTATNIGSSR